MKISCGIHKQRTGTEENMLEDHIMLRYSLIAIAKVREREGEEESQREREREDRERKAREKQRE
jgi:hypothetical protein